MERDTKQDGANKRTETSCGVHVGRASFASGMDEQASAGGAARETRVANSEGTIKEDNDLAQLWDAD